jgi:hypothetical protein
MFKHNSFLKNFAPCSIITYSFRFENEKFFARSRKLRDCAEAYFLYVAQAILKVDAEIAKKRRSPDENYLISST